LERYKILSEMSTNHAKYGCEHQREIINLPVGEIPCQYFGYSKEIELISYRVPSGEKRQIRSLSLRVPSADRVTTVRAEPRIRRFQQWAGRRNTLISVLVGIAFAIAAWLRIPALARDTLWAEDGRNFLQAAVNQGPIFSLFDPYAGYLHTIPRMISSLVVLSTPVPDYAYAMTAATCVAAGGAAAVVYVCSRDVVPFLLGRLALAGITVLAPLEPREVLGNAANLHSIMFWMLFWMLLYRPKSRAGSYLLGVIAALAALTEIQSLFLIPLLLLALRDRRRWPMRVGYLLGAATQVVVTLVWSRAPAGNPAVGIPSILYGYLINSVAPLWMPQNAIGPSVAAGGVPLSILLTVPIVAALVITVIRGSALQRVTAIALAVGSVLVYSASVIDNPNSFYDYASFSTSQLETLWLTRYGVVPSMMLIAVLVLGATTAWRTASAIREPREVRVHRQVRRVARVGAAGVIAVLLLAQFTPQGTRRSSGPAWQPQILSTAQACERRPDSAAVNVKETIGWTVTLDCGAIEQYG
jgi:hypothetical protein